ncbi:uncharacterized protein VTP21DRAFT_3414 [Calcarisporiella thermophila]|uniref:uncharacterized protein n=1 Tax=Calcarisporiella thermophila TaxID=911321 RepID=UPI0037444EFB
MYFLHIFSVLLISWISLIAASPLPPSFQHIDRVRNGLNSAHVPIWIGERAVDRFPWQDDELGEDKGENDDATALPEPDVEQRRRLQRRSYFGNEEFRLVKDPLLEFYFPEEQANGREEDKYISSLFPGLEGENEGVNNPSAFGFNKHEYEWLAYNEGDESVGRAAAWRGYQAYIMFGVFLLFIVSSGLWLVNQDG